MVLFSFVLGCDSFGKNESGVLILSTGFRVGLISTTFFVINWANVGLGRVMALSEDLVVSSIRPSSAFGQMGTKLSWLPSWLPSEQLLHFLDRLDETFPPGLIFRLSLKPVVKLLLLALTKLEGTLLFMVWNVQFCWKKTCGCEVNSSISQCASKKIIILFAVVRVKVSFIFFIYTVY